MKRIVLVNQRYGQEVNGGSEYYTKLLAEHLKKNYQVEILTTTAASYDTWDNYYEEGVFTEDGIHIRRFKVEKRRDVRSQKFAGKLLNLFGLKWRWMNRLWIEAQGPYVPGLIEYIKDNRDVYDIFIFVTYLYYPTVYGMAEVKNKAIFIPTAHNERYIHFDIYKKLFQIPKGIIFLTEEEKKFVHSCFENVHIPYTVTGVGIDIPPDTDEERFRKKYGITGRYLIYVGRVDENKGCKQMFDIFCSYHSHDQELELVVMGQRFMELPPQSYVHYLGFVSEEDKFDAVKGAEALWLPSEYESLSISVLEAMAMAKPVLVNGRCEVLKGHCVKSKGGIYYDDIKKAEASLEWFSEKDKNRQQYDMMCRNAYEYIQNNYTWDRVMERFTRLLETV